MKKIYCLNCDREETYHTTTEKMNVTVKGFPLEITYTHAFCDKCGHEVFPHSIDVLNDLAAYDKYRRLNGLLTSDEIRAIRQKRGMSQVELARFIGCGEKNIARYETGTIQDKVFDNLIRMVGDDDCYYAMIKLKEKTPTLVTQ